MRNWKGILAMGLSSALVIGAIQLVPEQTAKNANAETVNTSDNMTPPSRMPHGTPPAKPDGDTNGGQVVLLRVVHLAALQVPLQVMMPLNQSHLTRQSQMKLSNQQARMKMP